MMIIEGHVRTRSVKVAIEGFYGYGNLGDEAILAGLVRALSRDTRIRPVIFTRRPSVVRTEHRLRAVHSQSNVLRRVVELATSRLYMLGGGGILKDYGADSASLLRWLDNVTLAHKVGRPVVLACAGVENIRHPESRARLVEALEEAADVTVRDGSSKDLLRELGVTRKIHVGGDPALLLTEASGPRSLPTEGGLRVLVCVRHWYRHDFVTADERIFQSMLQGLAQAMDHLACEHGAEISLVPLRSTPIDNDVEVAERARALMGANTRPRVLKEVPSIAEFIQLVRRSDLMIGMRLHALILAAAQGVPAVGLGYMTKVHSFMHQLGQEGLCLDLESISGQRLITLLEGMVADYNRISASLVRAVGPLRRSVDKAAARWLALAGHGRDSGMRGS